MVAAISSRVPLKAFSIKSLIPHVLIDIKGIQNRLDAEEQGFLYWRM